MAASDTPTLTARGAATRSRIVNAAADLIYAHGVDRTSLHEVIVLQTERVLGAQEPHLGALDSIRALQSWRNAIVQLDKRTHSGGCPLGSLASELANDSETARKRLAAGFEMWSNSIERGLTKMRERGELAASADPHELAIALLSAVQGGLLLAKTMRTS